MATDGAIPTELFHHTYHHDSAKHYQAAKAVFEQFASVQEEGERFMTSTDFARALWSLDPATQSLQQSPSSTSPSFSSAQYDILFRMADARKRGRISIADFQAFQLLLSRPYAEFEMAFKLLDTQGRGTLSLSDFKQIVTATEPTSSTTTPSTTPLHLDPAWLSLYARRSSPAAEGEIDYHVFGQMIHELQVQRLQHSFREADTSGCGVISPEAFQRIVYGFARERVSPLVLEHIPTLARLGGGSSPPPSALATLETEAVAAAGPLTYPLLVALYQLVQKTDWVEVILIQAAQRHPQGRVTRDSFLATAAQVTRAPLLTPLETDVLFHLVEVEAVSESTPLGSVQPSQGFALADFRRLLDPTWRKPIPSEIREATTTLATTTPVAAETSPYWGWAMGVFEQAYMFALGSIAGAVGATVVYPIDLVKTRMQNQRSAVVGELLYKNSMDCFRKVIKNEGPKGLYRGLAPQLVGVAPEKAIKLTMNDLVRKYTTDAKTGQIPLWAEVLAGCTAGGSQVVFTNPLEIVKIRLQVQGEMLKSVDVVPRQSAISIVRQLGLVGLYKGAGACLLRDIPFSAIYFPVYAHIKKDVFLECPGVKLGIWQLLVAGALAGMPAAYLTTPADVIKTRLQVEARQGQTAYNGIRDAARKIYAEEGFRAFFKGGVARIFRSSPQFGTTLMVYEVLQRYFPFAAAGSETSPGGSGALPPPVASPSNLAHRPLTKPGGGGLLSPTQALNISQQAPLAYLRMRNAVKLVQDVQYSFGKLPPVPTTTAPPSPQ
ncbi:mitochondrial aspartate-glutamate transporter agc1 [Dimargaris cristalligena]|uniref:Mitochondrial aspartate-glutamate transporter AGC1 n=1 Tax=Dimargaris cristalligena TaxID=215637 RepID=A0A4P9ZQY8_9FUNG|nr:mitochondrial aspartate-glutamate transporter agc1 [Dimargaris cristalligena]RKP35745.1 mitochondrial carrier domain-containing protein [Dimargaris cristalligena]|eukprot:RKP35745.1 mitochondrial carrier domain-containing protein [Dimargaris cristalligena]